MSIRVERADYQSSCRIQGSEYHAYGSERVVIAVSGSFRLGLVEYSAVFGGDGESVLDGWRLS